MCGYGWGGSCVCVRVDLCVCVSLCVCVCVHVHVHVSSYVHAHRHHNGERDSPSYTRGDCECGAIKLTQFAPALAQSANCKWDMGILLDLHVGATTAA